MNDFESALTVHLFTTHSFINSFIYLFLLFFLFFYLMILLIFVLLLEIQNDEYI